MGVQISLPRPIFKYFRILSQVGGTEYTIVLETIAERHKGSSPLLGIVHNIINLDEELNCHVDNGFLAKFT